MRFILVALLGAVALSACGGYEPTSPDAADVRIRQIYDMSEAAYIHGMYSYVRVERLSGDKLIEERLADAAGTYPRFISRAAVRLDPGEYRLASFQRPCESNCGSLAAPTDECNRLIQVSPGDAVEVTVTVRPGEGCRIEFE